VQAQAAEEALEAGVPTPDMAAQQQQMAQGEQGMAQGAQSMEHAQAGEQRAAEQHQLAMTTGATPGNKSVKDKRS
jgi:hypothetical protein